MVGSKGRIYVSWTEPKKVVGIHVGLRQVGEKSLDQLLVKGLWSPRIGRSGFKQSPESGIWILYSGLATSDLRNYNPIDQLIILFVDNSVNVDSCYNGNESTDTYCLVDEYNSLFYIPEDFM